MDINILKIFYLKKKLIIIKIKQIFFNYSLKIILLFKVI